MAIFNSYVSHYQRVSRLCWILTIQKMPKEDYPDDLTHFHMATTQLWHNARGEYRSTQRMFALVGNDTGGSQPHGIPLYCIIPHKDKAMPRNIAQSSLTLKLEDLQPKTNKFVVTVSSLQEAGPSWGHPLHVWRVLLTILDIVHHCNWWTLDLQSLSIHD